MERRNQKSALRQAAAFFADVLYNVVFIIALVALIRTFIISPFSVIGISMANTLENGQFILIDKLSYNLSEPKRGDPVVFLPPITSRDPEKFEILVTTNESGAASLDISSLQGTKKQPYCQKTVIRHLWLCQEKVEEGDWLYIIPKDKKSLLESAENLAKRQITAEEITQGKVLIEGQPNQEHVIRIYGQTGADYFVKRIIGVPGDTVRIENGRVYLKEAGQQEFRELDEAYLNEENANHTFLQKNLPSNSFTVPEGHYFLMGDNRNHSNDSRSWLTPITQEPTPFVPKEYLSGKVALVLWPIWNLQWIGGEEI